MATGDRFNPIALKVAKTLWSFDRSECKRGKTEEAMDLSCDPWTGSLAF